MKYYVAVFLCGKIGVARVIFIKMGSVDNFFLPLYYKVE